jgi:hypothetical protein
MIYMKILKKGGGGSREKGGGGNEIHAPCACAQGQRQLFCNIVQLFVFFIEFDFLYAIKPI